MLLMIIKNNTNNLNSNGINQLIHIKLNKYHFFL